MPRREVRPGVTTLLVAVGTCVGLAVGAVVGGTSAPPSEPSAVATPPPAPSGPPPAASCLRAAELGEQVVDLAEEASSAMAARDARTLEELLGEMRDRDVELREQATRCRQAEPPAQSPTRSPVEATEQPG